MIVADLKYILKYTKDKSCGKECSYDGKQILFGLIKRCNDFSLFGAVKQIILTNEELILSCSDEERVPSSKDCIQLQDFFAITDHKQVSFGRAIENKKVLIYSSLEQLTCGVGFTNHRHNIKYQKSAQDPSILVIGGGGILLAPKIDDFNCPNGVFRNSSKDKPEVGARGGRSLLNYL